MRVISLIYGVFCYLSFLVVTLYFVGFVGNLYVPKSIDSDVSMGVFWALIVNVGLLISFGLQHSIMARDQFKVLINDIIPSHIERSTYVAFSTIALMFLMLFWQPINFVVWSVRDPVWKVALCGGCALGWLLVFVSTFLTDHFDLFGLRQVWLHFMKKKYTGVEFREYGFYRWIRHPMMLGFIIAIWSTPTMTLGHLVFSIGLLFYILVGIYFEEQSLVRSIGDDYIKYQKRTAKIIPKIF